MNSKRGNENKQAKRVVNTTTGQEFDSIRQAWESWYFLVCSLTHFRAMLNDRKKNNTEFKKL